MTRTITLIGARGGSGASTIAAALALHTAEDVPTALLTHDPTAMARLLGTTGAVPAPTDPFAVGPRLTVAGLDGPKNTATIIDAGPAVAAGQVLPADGLHYTVVRGPCYLALATLVSLPHLRPDGVILVAEPGRSLSAADTSVILGVPVVATVPVRSSIARLIDAGLLAGRPSEIPGLDHLSDALVRGLESFPSIPKIAGGRIGPDVPRNGLTQAVSSGWGHDL
jgi:hypothetical protein